MGLRFNRWLVRGMAMMALAGCGRAPTSIAVVPAQSAPTAAAEPTLAGIEYPITVPERTTQQRYESELSTAAAFFREEKLPEAYAALKRAQALNDTALVKSILATIEARAEFGQVANAAATTISTFLAEGRYDLANPLVRDAVRIYGGSPVGSYFASLQRQLDAIEAVNAEPSTRSAQVQKDLDQSFGANSLRGGVLALEQAALTTNDARFRRPFEELRTRLLRFEEAMTRGFQYRRDPSRRRDFNLAMREAAELWPTWDIARMIDEVALIDQCARDRVVLLDFDVHGIPSAITVARAVANDLSAALRGRYDLVERSEWTQTLSELSLTAEQIMDDADARREFAQRANIRYLVLGDVHAGNGIVVFGRILDAVTGEVVQTGRIVGVAPDSMERFIAQFVAMLLMTDEQRWAYESQLSQIAAPAPPIAVSEMPRMPETIAADAPPRVLAASVRCPDQDSEFADAVRTLITGGGGVPAIADDHPLRDPVCWLAVERGDDLLRRGKYQAAHNQYLRAFGLSRNPLELSPRFDRCRPHVQTQDAATAKPRLILCDFAVPSGFAAPGAGACISDCLAAYAAPHFSVIDRTETNWCMERLGLANRDLAHDPNARFYLARALDARYVGLGMVTRDPSGLEASLVVLDAETGQRLAAPRVRSGSWPELRDRLDELVDPVNWTPAIAAKLAAAEAPIQNLLSEARKHAHFKDFSSAAELARDAVKLRPNSARIRKQLAEFERQIQLTRQTEDQEVAAIRRMSLLHSERQARAELLRRIEAAKSTTKAEPVAEADRVRRRDLAQTQLIAQARSARSDGDYELAAHQMAAAIALNTRPELEQEFMQIRRQFISQHRARIAKESNEREAARQSERESELLAIKTRLDAARKDRAGQLQAWTAWRSETDRREHARLLTEARSIPVEEGRHLWVVQSARRLSAAGETERLVVAARLAQARAAAHQRGRTAEFEAQLANDHTERPKLEAVARRNLNFYLEALKNGEQALRYGQYERAAKLYSEALRYVQTDDALRGLRSAQDEQQRAKELADARASAERSANADVAKLIDTGRTAFEQGRLDEALSAFRRARTAAPANPDVESWIARAEKAQLDQLAAERPRPVDVAFDSRKPNPASANVTAPAPAIPAAISPDPKPAAAESPPPPAQPAVSLNPAARLKADFDRLVDQGQVALSFRRFEEAELALDSALRLVPNDPGATKLLEQARSRIGPPPEFVRHMQSAANLEKQDRYGDALQAYREALKIVPGDPVASRRADYSQRMDLGFKALRSNDRHQAAMEFESALQAVPNDPAAQRALKQAKIK